MTDADAKPDAPQAGGIPRDALPESTDLPWMILASIAINVLALALPLLMLQVFDRILPHNALDTLALLIMGTAVAVTAEAVLRYLRASVMVWAAARFEHGAMMQGFSRVLATRSDDQDRTTLAERFKAISALRDYFSGQTFLQLLDLPFTVFYLLLVYVIGGWIVIVPLAGALAFGLLSFRFGRVNETLFRQRSAADRRRSSFLVETLTGIHTVKAMAMESFMLRRYERLQEACARLTRRLAGALDVASGVGGLFSPLMTVLLVAAGGVLVIAGEMSNGELAACIMLVLRSLGPLQRTGSLWIWYQQIGALRDEIVPLFRNAQTVPDQPATADPAMLGRLELRDTGYAMPGADTRVVDGVSLVLEPGECVVIQGANGSGRSTLMRLMAGLQAPASGEILLDGRPLHTLTPQTLRSLIAFVPENAQLFQGTILENISGFDPARADHALRVGKLLGLDRYVSRLPRGWDSMVGESSGDSTPVGYRQRIAMVRALVESARIVLFDTANVSMDSDGDTALRQYFESLKGHTTMVIVTHRPSLARLADRVLLMENGRLVPMTEDERPAPAAPEPARADDPVASAAFHAGPEEAESNQERTRRAVLNNFGNPGDLALCVSELLKALDWRGDPRDVAESLPYFEDVLDLSGLLNCMAQLGYRTGHSPMRLGEIDRRLLPCLFLPAGRPALVVHEQTDEGWRVYEGASGDTSVIGDVNLRGDAYFFTALREEAHAQGRWVGLVLGRMRPLLAQAMFSAVIYGLVLLPVPLFVMAVYGSVLPSGAALNLVWLTLGALAAIAVGGLFVAHRARILSYIAGRIDYVFGTAVFRQILALPPSMSESASVGAQIARLSSFESIRDLFTGPVASTLIEAPALIVFVIALAIINPPALLVVAVTTLLYVLLYFLIASRVDRNVAEFSRWTTQRHEFLVETMTKLHAIRDFGGERAWLRRFRDISASAAMSGFRVGRVAAALAAGGFLLNMAGALGIIVVCIAGAATGTFGVGIVIASTMLGWRIVGPVQTAFVNLTRIDRVRSAAGQVERLMSLRGERQSGVAGSAARTFRGRVEFERASFRYSLDTDPAIVGASFTVEPGTTVAITGPNGGGKSTLLKLLAGLYHPQAGNIRIDATDLRQIDPVALRRAIGYVPQESSLFRGTIAQNLRFVRPAATDEELNRALALSGALNDVALLPEGIQTRVGDDSTGRLSASLKQKLSLARAYLTRAPVLLFDEPGNTLDIEGDRWFVEALRKLRGHSTIFLVTHRPSHIRMADLALVLQGGYLRFAGPPAEALKRIGIGA